MSKGATIPVRTPEIPGAQQPLQFSGSTYEAERDQQRLSGQALRVFELMKDGRWLSLGRISQLTGDPEQSVSARLRDFRKSAFGGHTTERRYVEDGLWEYRLIVRKA